MKKIKSRKKGIVVTNVYEARDKLLHEPVGIEELFEILDLVKTTDKRFPITVDSKWSLIRRKMIEENGKINLYGVETVLMVISRVIHYMEKNNKDFLND